MRLAASIALAFALSSPAASAQPSAHVYTVRGKVYAPSGDALEGAAVRLVHRDHAARLEGRRAAESGTSTAADGGFTIRFELKRIDRDARPGARFELIVDAPGLARHSERLPRGYGTGRAGASAASMSSRGR